MNLICITNFDCFFIFSRLAFLFFVISLSILISSNLQKSLASSAATFTVINTNDSGAGSLRQAILEANANVGTDTIVFNIGSGVQVIRPTSVLPIITDSIIIDGSTQPSFSGTPLIVIDGASAGSVNGLEIRAGNSQLRSIAIINFQSGQALRVDNNGGNVIRGCYFGVDPDGVTQRRNNSGIIITSSNNLIGGTTAADRNVVSGNSFDNIYVTGAASNNRIQGNYIGTNATGTSRLNGGGYGIQVATTGSGNVVGGTEPGAGNLISGNGQSGIVGSARDTIIQGNFIGTDVTGTMPIPNLSGGMRISNLNVLVGGTTPAARNIISGNNGVGVNAEIGDGTTRSRVQGNYIGVDITGRNILANSSSGIEARSATIIGGTKVGAGNVISGNLVGITLGGSDNPGSLVQGNLIGTDASGTIALGNAIGFDIRSSNNAIGGTIIAAKNVISGNRNLGIDIGSGTTAQLAGNVIQGNYIGVDITRTIALPNGGVAISITGSNTLIGGTTEGAGNIIAYNNGAGVRISGSFGSNVRNLIRRNSFFMNSGLAIDLGVNGVTPNDACDGDTGANNLQNYPVLTSAVSNGATTSVTGSLNSTPGATFDIDFYVNPTYDNTGFGEGKNYIGSTSITTATNCVANFNVTLPFQAAGGQFVTATATDSNGNTSEFSQYVQAAGASIKANFDFDGDGRSDISVFRPSDRVWYLLRSQSGFSSAQFGISTDKITPADFDGDGRADIAVFRDGVWYWLNSSNGSFNAVQFGIASDIPVPADYTGDGRAEIAVYRGGIWYTLDLANNQFQAVQFGISTDKPVPADFDGDGKTDYAVYRDGIWYLLRSSQGFTAVQFGISSDKPVVGDYDGDGKADQAVYRSGVWYVLGSIRGFYAVQFGIASDVPIAADYDGDGSTDIAVFRDGVWYWLQSSSNQFRAVQFGIANDKPIPAAFVP